MKKLLTAALTLVILLSIATQSSAQVATFNSLSLHFSNTILTTAQYHQVLKGSQAKNADQEEYAVETKQHLGALPATGYVFGDNTAARPMDILATPTSVEEPMAVALEKWVTKELALQEPKRRNKR
ncbi:hypothetical protein [uncultured Pontibacter sp.]|uniref:hypothetical protein n=1 Tax=uncultured Pontibacter sp. TaxID=453356 RepID=UPI00260D5143|nr:hypothetical protein [uncultured Pontibacter sp.]